MVNLGNYFLKKEVLTAICPAGLFLKLVHTEKEYAEVEVIKHPGLKVVWGFDSDGDFALKVGEIVYSFYKWSEPTIHHDEGFTPLTDSNAKKYWKKTREKNGRTK